MNFFQLCSNIRIFAGALTNQQCAEFLRLAQREVVNGLGGAKNRRLMPYMQRTTTGRINSTNNFVVLPHGSGDIVRVTVNNKPSDVISLSDELAATSNPLYSRSCVREGNVVRFPNMPFILAEDNVFETSATGGSAAKQPWVDVTIVHEKDIRTILYLDGLEVADFGRKYGYGGSSYPIYSIVFPTDLGFENEELAGGMLRIYQSAGMARDYGIFTNSDYQSIAVLPQYDVAPINMPDFKTRTYSQTIPGTTVRAENVVTHPAVLSHIWIPPELHSAMIAWVNWYVTKNSASLADFNRALESFR